MITGVITFDISSCTSIHRNVLLSCMDPPLNNLANILITFKCLCNTPAESHISIKGVLLENSVLSFELI